MNLAEYKKLLTRDAKAISDKSSAEFAKDWRIGAVEALNVALFSLGYTHFPCTNENTANAVLSWADRKAGR